MCLDFLDLKWLNLGDQLVRAWDCPDGCAIPASWVRLGSFYRCISFWAKFAMGSRTTIRAAPRCSQRFNYNSQLGLYNGWYIYDWWFIWVLTTRANYCRYRPASLLPGWWKKSQWVDRQVPFKMAVQHGLPKAPNDDVFFVEFVTSKSLLLGPKKGLKKPTDCYCRIQVLPWPKKL